MSHIKLKDLLLEVYEEEIPKILYHATFNELIPSISNVGLIPWGKEYRNFMDTEEGVYLGTNPDFAASFVEVGENENVPEEWYDNIVVISIDVTKLDIKKFDSDPQLHMSDSPDKAFIYRGKIPTSSFIDIEDYQ